MTDFTGNKSENVRRYLGRRFRPLACATISAAAVGLAGTVVPATAQAQNELNAEEVQLVLQKNRELLDTIDALTEKLGISPGDNPWADYQQQIKSLQSELGNVRSQLGLAERRMSENAALVDNLRSQHAERVEQLQKQLLEAANAVDETKKQSEEETASALAKAGEMSEQLEQLQSNLTARENRLAGLKSQLLQTISSKNTEQVALQQQLGKTLAALDSSTADYKDQQAVIESLRADLGSTNIDLKKASAELAEAASTDEQQKADLNNAKRVVGLLQTALSKREAVVRKQDIGISKLTAANAELKHGLAASQEESKQNQMSLQAATAEINDLKQTQTTLQQQVANRAEVIKRQDQGINRLLARLGVMGDDLRESAEASAQRESDLMAEIAQHSQAIEAGKGDQRRLRMENRDLLAAYRESDDMAVKLDLELRQLNADLGAERERQSELLAQLEKTQQTVFAAAARNLEFKQQITELEGNLEKSGGENSRLAEMLVQAADENAVVGKQLQAANEKGADLEARLGESQASFAQSESDLADSRTQLQAALEQEKTLTGFLDETRQVADTQREKIQTLQQEITASQDALAQLDNTLGERDSQISDFQSNVNELRSNINELEDGKVALESQLASRLEQNESLQQDLSGLRDKAAAPRKAALALREQVGKSLKEQGINDTVLAIRPDNSVTFKIPNELLFVSGSARLNRNGRTMLAQVGEALSKTDESINIRVEGHTDSVPVAEKFRHIFPSNWYLSVARAANAVDFLQNQAAMDPARLSATGFGEFSPLASNDTEEGRNRNRRVEIVLIPDADAGQAGS